VVLDDLSTGLLENLEGAEFEFHQGSVLDTRVLARALKGVSRVIHLAALGSVPRSIRDPLQSHLINATGTITLLESCRNEGVRHFTFASSSSVYGGNPHLPRKENDWTQPLSPYAASKLSGESYVQAYAASYGLGTLAFRFFNVFGPRQRADHQYAAVIPRFLAAATAGRTLEIYGDGHQTRDFTFVDTVTSVLLKASLGMVTTDTPLNLALGTRTSINELVSELDGILGRKLSVAHLPERAADVSHSQSDPARLLELFGVIDTVSLRDALGRTAAWYLDSI
jgi:UDP-glucose 4-epimerase